jgi:choline dehydrogenase-like flavoprotein
MRDIIVVGAGGGGPVVAKELAARGLDVLLLEAGPRFASPETEWSHFDNDSTNPSNGIFRFGPADRSRPPWVRELPQNSILFQLSGVGGSTNHFLANTPRAMPGAFLGYDGIDRDNYDTAHPLPIPYRELLPYYEWVEETLPVRTAPMGTKEAIFFAAARRLGLAVQTTKDIFRAAFRPQENAILQPRGHAGRTSDPHKLVFPAAEGCTFCGHCAQGCIEPLKAPINLIAKRSTSVSYVPMALTADLWAAHGKPVSLITDAFVQRVTTDSTGVARSVTWRLGKTGELVTEEARVIVLAGGGVETPRLWLNSGLPNPNDWVGRGLTDHFVDLVIGVTPSYTGSSKGPQSAARIDYPGYGMLENVGKPPGPQAALTAFSDAGIRGFYDNGFAGGAHGADGVGRLVGPDLKFVMENLDRLLNIDVFPDDDVEAQNRVTLSSAYPPDENGPVPRVEIHQRNRSLRTVRNREFLAAKAVELLRAAGATKVFRIGFPPFVFHIHSTMRMGLDPANSVLDEHSESRWVKRLFVTDNSGLANGLGGMNPTLTMQALATRTAERIFQAYFGGHPWVRSEAPLSSIDTVITKAVIERGIG